MQEEEEEKLWLAGVFYKYIYGCVCVCFCSNSSGHAVIKEKKTKWVGIIILYSNLYNHPLCLIFFFIFFLNTDYYKIEIIIKKIYQKFEKIKEKKYV